MGENSNCIRIERVMHARERGFVIKERIQTNSLLVSAFPTSLASPASPLARSISVLSFLRPAARILFRRSQPAEVRPVINQLRASVSRIVR